MTDKTPAQKGHVKPGARVALVNETPQVLAALGLPDDATFVDTPEADVVMLVAGDRSELDALMPATVDALGEHAVLWVLFRKGAKAAGLDMSRNDVWAIAESKGMRPLGIVGVDQTWSAFRLRRGDVE